MKKIAVLISCFNRKDTTIRCLEKLHSNDLGDRYLLDVFLVDDKSTDGTGQAVAERFPAVRVINGNGNLYWNRGMCLAWRAAGYHGYDHYLLLNDDVQLFDGALLKLLDIYETACLKKPFILVGSTCDPLSGQGSYGGEKRSGMPFKKLRFNLIIPGNEIIEADTMNGNIALIPEGISSSLNGLDPRFTHAMGDTDFGLRAAKAGFSVQVAPSYFGTCAKNSATDSHTDISLPKKIRWKKMLSTKGLPMREWSAFCRRHAGIFWPVYFLWPYLKFLVGP